MTRFIWVASLVVACSSPLKATQSATQTASPPPPAPVAAWIGSLKSWYCGMESLPPKVAADGVPVPRVRDLALKIVPGNESFTVVYASVSGTDKSVGTMTRFVAGTGTTATLHWENDQKQKGEAVLAFAPDYSTVTVTWTASASPPGSSPLPPAATTLAAAAGASGCVAGAMIR